MATREALVNTLCHRDYSIGGGSVGVAIYDDRLEITSSGTLHFGLTPEKLFAPHESIPWNPLIADTSYRRGIIERWGRGTLRMAELIADAGLPKPEIEDGGGGGCVTVRFRHELSPVHIAGIGKTGAGGSTNLVLERRPADGLNELQRVVFQVLDRGNDPLALREIRVRLGTPASTRQVRRALARLNPHFPSDRFA